MASYSTRSTSYTHIGSWQSLWSSSPTVFSSAIKTQFVSECAIHMRENVCRCKVELEAYTHALRWECGKISRSQPGGT